MPTAFEISDRYVDELAQIFPTLATSLGVPGRHDRWGMFGLEGVEAAAAVGRRHRLALEPFLDADDPRERVAARVAVDAIDEDLERVAAGDHLLDLGHMASTFQRFRSVFDVMPVRTVEEREDVVRRLETIDQPINEYRELLTHGINSGQTVARRQVLSVIDQARNLAGSQSSFLQLAEGFGAAERTRLDQAIERARAVYAEFAGWLEDAYLPEAIERDAVGNDRYRRAANRLVGLEVDPAEAYEWGWEEFHRLADELNRVGSSILPDVGWDEVRAFLETDPGGTARSTGELASFVTEVLEEAVEQLSDRHFDVPEDIRPITVQIAPRGGPLGVSYVRPSEDLTRPGGVWYSIGDQTVFPLYQHRSTAYHEGFPGHHLQIATQMYQREKLSRFQRVLAWYPGFGEGWAMYAEVLMGELGYLERPESYFGMLAKQMYRAVRVVVDIGLHLGCEIPSASPIAPGERWSYETAVRFMQVYGFRTPAQAEGDVLRYLGWPGQAIAYKLGEREILSLREDTKRRLGAGFDLKRFHAALLENGQMRLDFLRELAAEQLS